MSPAKRIDANDLEEVAIEPRSARGAVLSIRLSSAEAQELARQAEHSGVSLSEYARNVLRKARRSEWRLWGFGIAAAPPIVVGFAPSTGGEYGRQLEASTEAP